MWKMFRDIEEITEKEGLFYRKDSRGKPRKLRPWKGEYVALIYDYVMAHMVFPKKFGASLEKHETILREELRSWEGGKLLDLGAGTGAVAEVLPRNISYWGVDLSSRLLLRGKKRFAARGFSEASFFVTSAEELPFRDHCFDLSLCSLSLNFFSPLSLVLQELRRVLVRQGAFFCVVPVPERQPQKSVIRGTLYSEEELRRLFEEEGFSFQPLEYENGALLYFKAFAKEEA